MGEGEELLRRLEGRRSLVAELLARELPGVRIQVTAAGLDPLPAHEAAPPRGPGPLHPLVIPGDI